MEFLSTTSNNCWEIGSPDQELRAEYPVTIRKVPLKSDSAHYLAISRFIFAGDVSISGEHVS